MLVLEHLIKQLPHGSFRLKYGASMIHNSRGLRKHVSELLPTSPFVLLEGSR
jgi:hypothetical protein